VNLWSEKDLGHLRNCADRGEIPKWAVPDEVLFVDAIDKISVGKIDKNVLREKFGSRSCFSIRGGSSIPRSERKRLVMNPVLNSPVAALLREG
jgi:hypothetical protein